MTLRRDTITTTTTRTPQGGPVRWWLLLIGAALVLTVLTWGWAVTIERATRDAAEHALADAGFDQVQIASVSYRDVMLMGPEEGSQDAMRVVDELALTRGVEYALPIAIDEPDASASPEPADTATETATETSEAAAEEPSPEPTEVVLPDLPDLAAIQFETGSATLTASSAAVLDEAASTLLDALEARPGLAIEIEGHTDNTGDADANLALSQARADAVVTALTDRGVPAAVLTATGLGQTEPIADNSTDEGRAQNRRVEFVITEG